MKSELPLHDATFDGLVLQGRDCKLYFTTSDKRGCEVALIDVDALQMEDFRNGNMVVFFGTLTLEAPAEVTDLGRLYSPPHTSAKADYHAQYAAVLDRKITAIAAGKLTLIEMEPAIGANLLATCAQVQFRIHD